MSQNAGRVSCPRCGANNFDKATTCWKCSTPLLGSAPAAYPNPPGGYMPVERAYIPPTAPTGDPGTAQRAAIWLALTIPWVGLPVGWVFMMIEDSRKQAIGRTCVFWSCIALVFHLLLMFALTETTMSLLARVLPAIGGAAQNSLHNGGLGGGLGNGP